MSVFLLHWLCVCQKMMRNQENLTAMCDYVVDDVWIRTSAQHRTRVGSEGGNGISLPILIETKSY